MDVLIEKSGLKGTVRAIPSKSDAHRALICAALSDAPCDIGLNSFSRDTEATMDCLRAMGARFEIGENAVGVTPVERATIPDCALFDCRESGSTLRFLLPVAAALCREPRFTGEGRLPERPLEAIMVNFHNHGVDAGMPKLPFTLYGRLRPGRFFLPGNCSSQFLSGLFFALPLLNEDSEIRIEGRLESAGYAEMTLRTLHRFGVRVEAHDSRFVVPGNQSFHAPTEYRVEGDWSNAAFFLAARELCGGAEVEVEGLDADSAQPDRAFSALYKKLGGEIDVSSCPDIFPILAVCAAFHNGTSRFTGGARLRIKESDRIESMARALRLMGADISANEDGMEIRGGKALHGAELDGAGDHRIVMALSIAGSLVGGTLIRGAEAVEKSYPDFFEDLKKLGGKYYVV